MLCLFVTGVLRPDAPRIGSLGSNIQLPRSLPLIPTLGTVAGALVGAVVGLVVAAVIGGSPMIVTLVSASMFGYGGLMAVTYQPWRGESLRKVVWVTAKQRRLRQRHLCPGSTQPTDESERCVVCDEQLRTVEGFAPYHTWLRAVYIGFQRIVPGLTGPVRVYEGNCSPDDAAEWQTQTWKRRRRERRAARGAIFDFFPAFWGSKKRDEAYDVGPAHQDVEEGVCGCGCGAQEIPGRRYHAHHLAACRTLAAKLRRVAEVDMTRRHRCVELLRAWGRVERPMWDYVHGLPPATKYAGGLPQAHGLMLWREMAANVLADR